MLIFPDKTLRLEEFFHPSDVEIRSRKRFFCTDAVSVKQKNVIFKAYCVDAVIDGKGKAWICPARIVDKIGKPTSLILLQLIITECADKRIDGFILDENPSKKDKNISRIQTITGELRKEHYWSDPSFPIPYDGNRE